MAKDYFKDAVEEGGQSGARETPARRGPSFSYSEGMGESRGTPQGERSIRNISISPRRAMRNPSGETHEVAPPPRSPSRGRRRWLWIAAVLSLVILVVLGLFAFRATAVTVIPTSRAIEQNGDVHIVGYLESAAPTGSLTYTLSAYDFEDSGAVSSQGVEKVSVRASGNITLYNEYSDSSVRLLKNTRLEAPNGLIFRIPEEVVIPGKKGASPGSITVTAAAERSGEQYNVAPVSRFTLPGLKGNAAMYAKVYARSSVAMSGGFEGERPAVPVGELDAARADIRVRLQKKAQEAARALMSDATIVLLDLMSVKYESLPQTIEAGGGVRIHEKAHVEIPVFPAGEFAAALADTIAISLSEEEARVVGADALAARSEIDSSGTALAEGPLDFTLNGKALLVWNIDVAALSRALAGRAEGEFQTIIANFASIQEARARIEPFWRGSFPEDESDIKIKVTAPPSQQ
ncbi:MAG: hypothetical protein UY63_C0013G0032 [Parcubacteria group bacterium GW2011_GWA2_51_10]|nr:MAG: hypothetical protein UY63_C0013G0032 [Parcubacteria group bacterium GW2011_GWA2_51_10]